MARKLEFRSGVYGWATERVEDHMLIAGFHEIEGKVPPDQSWRRDFSDHFYIHGNPISSMFIATINAARRRSGLKVIEFVETNIYDYGKLRDKLRKSELRRQMRDEYVRLDTLGRLKWRERAEDDVAALPAPHHTLEEWKAMRNTLHSAPTRLTEQEIARRAEAIAPKVPPAVGVDSKTRAKKQLVAVIGLPSAGDLIPKILSAISGDDALELLPDINDPVIRTALIEHSLAP